MGVMVLGAPRAANPLADPSKVGGGFESPLPPHTALWAAIDGP